MSSDKDDLLIYPSSLKYNDSKKQPYSAFMDRLNIFLKQDDTVLFVCGYSFNDEHINERIFSALQTNTTAHVFVLYYDKICFKDETGKSTLVSSFNADSSLGRLASRNRKISVLSTRTAIIGGQYGEWRTKPGIAMDNTLSSALYFKEDIEHARDSETEDPNRRQAKAYRGEFLLPDFVSFVELLRSMIPKNEWEGNNSE
jgi:hypothetical protein